MPYTQTLHQTELHRLRLTQCRESFIPNLFRKKNNLSLLKPKSLLNQSSNLPDSTSLLSHDLPWSSGSNKDLILPAFTKDKKKDWVKQLQKQKDKAEGKKPEKKKKKDKKDKKEKKDKKNK